jgi:hypothetical protein
MPRNERMRSDSFTPAELARRWAAHVGEGTLRNWRSQNRGPAFTKLPDRTIRYSLEAVLDFERHHPMRRSPCAAARSPRP